MRILVGKTFGIGNSCLVVPMIKALRQMGHWVDVLVGTGPDDVGAVEVFMYFMENHGFSPQCLYTETVPEGVDHDLAIMAIPFDGRWQNGVHYRATRVMDGRQRPGNVKRLGFDMWTKHEVEYQMENARELGFDEHTPTGGINEVVRTLCDTDLVYLGIGYKRDPGGFGLSKNFGTDRFGRLMHEIRHLRPTTRFVSTGSTADWVEVGAPLQKKWGDLRMSGPLYTCKAGSVLESINKVRTCAAYLGNDTGMMHVAAALGLRTFGLFAHKDLLVKNPPYTLVGTGLLFGPDSPSIEEIAGQFVSFVWG